MDANKEMTMTKLRITMTNNSDARRADILADIRSASAKHNGGKVVIVTIDDDDLEAARDILDGSHQVREWEVA